MSDVFVVLEVIAGVSTSLGPSCGLAPAILWGDCEEFRSVISTARLDEGSGNNLEEAGSLGGCVVVLPCPAPLA